MIGAKPHHDIQAKRSEPPKSSRQRLHMHSTCSLGYENQGKVGQLRFTVRVFSCVPGNDARRPYAWSFGRESSQKSPVLLPACTVCESSKGKDAERIMNNTMQSTSDT